jgi:hypothetical protein
MAIKYCVFDWNGTLYGPRDEVHTYKAIGLAVKEKYIPGFKPRFWGHPIKLAGLIKTKNKLDTLYQQIKSTGLYNPEREGLIREIYHLFNRDIIDGLPSSFIFGIADIFAEKAKNNIDHRLLGLVPPDSKITPGILSVAWEYIIKIMLRKSDIDWIEENILGDILEHKNSTAKGFNLRTYGKKHKFLETHFFQHRSFKPKETIYWGDSLDDEDCFDLITSEGGRVGLPFLLIESGEPVDKEFVNYCAKRYKAFVPKSPEDAKNFLTKS